MKTQAQGTEQLQFAKGVLDKLSGLPSQKFEISMMMLSFFMDGMEAQASLMNAQEQKNAV